MTLNFARLCQILQLHWAIDCLAGRSGARLLGKFASILADKVKTKVRNSMSRLDSPLQRPTLNKYGVNRV